MTRVTVPRTTFDLLLTPQLTLNSAESLALSEGAITVVYNAIQAGFGRAFQGDVDCDAEVSLLIKNFKT